MPVYALMSLNMPEHDRILLNVPEYAENAWINCSDYARVLNMPQYSYNNNYYIRIFVCLICISRRSATILSFFNTIKNIRIKKASKFLISYSSCLQWRQTFQVFKWTAGCIFKCETTKMKLGRNIKKDF